MKNFQLPKPIEDHIQATNSENPALFLSTFADNAVVFDAGKEYRGKDAIQAWSNRDYFGDHLRLEVVNVVQDGVECVVTAKCDGDYDKTGLPDPLYLDLHFTVEGGLVTRQHNVLSSNGKAVPLPRPVAAYYHACDVYDGEMLSDCFTQDAVLYDEEEQYRGPRAISNHILEANRSAQVWTEITDCGEKNGQTIVTATLSGNFEGSPVSLDFHFELQNGKIKALNIVPAGE